MVGAILDEEGRVLVTKRLEHLHQGGLWEFPGGKLEPGEAPEQGLARELAEELGIEVRASHPLIRIRHDYGDRRILLDVRRVASYSGTPAGLEGQPLAWHDPETLDPACFPAADRPIITALRLPERMLITGPDPAQPATFLARLEQALHRGIRLVQLRAHPLDDAAYRALVPAVFRLCDSLGARLLLNRHPESVADLPRHGLHLTARALAGLSARPGTVRDLVGASCHGVEDLRTASDLGLDYAVLSPVQPTASHPAANPIGWSTFATWVETAALPVFALGGLTDRDLAAARHRGAQGIAAIRAFWPMLDQDPAAARRSPGDRGDG